MVVVLVAVAVDELLDGWDGEESVQRGFQVVLIPFLSHCSNSR